MTVPTTRTRDIHSGSVLGVKEADMDHVGQQCFFASCGDDQDDKVKILGTHDQ